MLLDYFSENGVGCAGGMLLENGVSSRCIGFPIVPVEFNNN